VKVLLAEDDGALCEVITRNLRVRGHDVVTADTAEGAILQMVEDWPDAVVLDVNLPDYSAWEVLRRLGGRSRKDLRVVVISAAPISQKRIDEFKPDGALQKPFPLAALLHAVEGDAVEPDPETARSSF
jgi:DNA-binding response OmpR family regulator